MTARAVARLGLPIRRGRATAAASLAATALVVAGAAIVSAPALAHADNGPASVVAVLGFHGSRLADEIKRELESSRFEVLSAELGGRRWQDAAREVDAGRLTRGVAVDENDRTLTVYTRVAGQSGVDVRLVLSVDPADRMARRHACLSAVELLHALSENETETPSVLEALRGASPAARSGGGDGRRPTSAGATTPPAAGASPSTGAGGPARSPAGAAATPGPGLAAQRSSLATSPGSPGSPASDVELGVAARDAAWQLGAGATFGVETNGGPTSHLQFLGRIPATAHMALCARALWPLLATQTRTDGNDVRAWSFGTALSLQYTLAPQRRLRPYLGLGPGARLGITETTSMSASQTQRFTFSVTFGIEAGVRYALSPLVQVFFELASARAWLIPPRDTGDAGRAAANGQSARATVGILFES